MGLGSGQAGNISTVTRHTQACTEIKMDCRLGDRPTRFGLGPSLTASPVLSSCLDGGMTAPA